MDIHESLEINRKHRNGFFRSGISAWKFNLLLSAIAIGVYNLSFWRAVLDSQTAGGLHTWVFIGALVILVTAGFNLLISLYSFHPVHKILTVVLLLTAAVTQYFTLTYGIVIDKTMMLNVFQTDPREFTELIDIHLLLYFTGFGLIPACLIGKTRISYGRWPQQLKHIGMAVAISSVVAILVAASCLTSFSPFFREHRELRFLLNPANVVYSTGSLIMKNLHSNRPLHKIGQDAQLSQEWQLHTRKTVLLIVIGETARARNFSLNGYQRQTNPLLSKSEILFFHNVASCGTATASSLPCIFSKYSRNDFSISTHRNYENLLDITLRAGLRTIWIDNNSGCKGLCTRIEHKAIGNMDNAEMCNGGECFDEILVTELDQFLSLNTENAVVVLHQKGSHGPAYYRRVPEAFKRFTPVCESVELKECTQQEIVNAYDNTVLYTDYVLAQLIDTLKRHANSLDTALLYVSDHGESLGETGLYLHGLPYSIAPSEQTQVPMLVWLSSEYQHEFKVDPLCLNRKTAEPLSHDNLFHSVLGLLDINTNERNADLDIFAECRNK